jgi:DNA topoisomerase-1
MADRWIARRGTPTRGFTYIDRAGRVVRDRATLDRIARLRIPPAWRDVKIAASATASVQAWGFDARGRRQYRYHERAVERGQLRKYHRVRRMGHDLPSMRRRIARDFGARDLSRETVAAAAVRLISEAFFRVGSERYQRDNGTFGLTTLRKSHVVVRGDRLQFEYRGKGSIRQRQVVFDRQLATVIGRLMKTPGPRLFRYRHRGRWIDLTSDDVNQYLKQLGRARYTAKDFRTWGGTLRMATVLGDLGPGTSDREAARNVALAARLVSAELGNTPAICRASYVHPLVIARYVDAGVTISVDRDGGQTSARRRSSTGHSPEERALLAFLDRYFPERRRRAVRRERERRVPERREHADGDDSMAA